MLNSLLVSYCSPSGPSPYLITRSSTKRKSVSKARLYFAIRNDRRRWIKECPRMKTRVGAISPRYKSHDTNQKRNYSRINTKCPKTGEMRMPQLKTGISKVITCLNRFVTEKLVLDMNTLMAREGRTLFSRNLDYKPRQNRLNTSLVRLYEILVPSTDNLNGLSRGHHVAT